MHSYESKVDLWDMGYIGTLSIWQAFYILDMVDFLIS